MSTVQQRGLATAETALPATVDTRGPTIVVSASNSLDPTLAPVVYRCTGAADQVQINAAIVAVNAVGGGHVVLLEGTYVCAANVAMLSFVILSGNGWSSILEFSAGFVLIDAETDVVIERIYIDTKTQTAGTVCIDIDNLCARITIERCRFFSDDVGIDGGGIDDSTDIWILNNYFDATDGTSIILQGSAGNEVLRARIGGNTITAAGSDGIWYDELDYSVIADNVILETTRYGIFQVAGYRNVVRTNEIILCGDIGISMAGGEPRILDNHVMNCTNEAIVTTGGFGLTVGNYISTCGDDGIASSGANGIISNNMIVSPDGHGIYVTAAGNETIISNNWVSSSDEQGIESLGDNVTIIGNDLYATNIEGILITGIQNIIVGNRVRGNGIGDYPIRVTGLNCLVANNNLSNGFEGGVIVEAGRCTVIGNEIYNSGDQIIYLDNGDDACIVGNYIWDFDEKGIWVDSASTDPLIVGNYVTSGDAVGIQVDVRHAVVSGNYVTNNGTIGIFMNG
ncbi:unnamed protein product, partial [marine sediment metagenome]